jgi:hypothetical protein
MKLRLTPMAAVFFAVAIGSVPHGVGRTANRRLFAADAGTGDRGSGRVRRSGRKDRAEQRPVWMGCSR